MARKTRITLSTFESIRKIDDGLFHSLLKATTAEKPGGPVVVDSADIHGEAFKIAWAKWVERNPGLVLSEDSEQDELWQAEQAAARLEADKVFVKKHADEAAKRYFEYWVREKGLLDTARGTIFHEMEKRWERDQTPPSAALLDVVIELLSTQGVLQWGKPAVPVVPAVPPPPPPVLIDDPESPTGKSEQLSLNETPRSRHTKAQLRDWDARSRTERLRQLREANNQVAQAFRNAAAANEVTL